MAEDHPPMHTLQQAIMASDPTLPMNIATKQYVDNALAALVKLAILSGEGGTRPPAESGEAVTGEMTFKQL